MLKKILIITFLVLASFFVGGFSCTGLHAFCGRQVVISTLSPAQFQQSLQTGKFQLLDVRTSDEFASGHIAGALQADYYQTQAFSDYLDKLDKNASYLIYCRTGHRSGLVLDIMKAKGFTHVSDLAGGITAWQSQGYQVVQ